MKSTVLIVDDVEVNRIILREILCDEYDIIEAAGGEEALSLLFNAVALPQIILLDIMMPGMDGYETLKLLKENSRTKNIPVLFITAADIESNESRALRSGALDFIPKPFNSDVVKARVDIHVQLGNYRHNLEGLVAEKTEEINSLHQRILETLASIVEYRSLESGLHIKRVKEFTRTLLDCMSGESTYTEFIERNYDDMIMAVTMHDIGKVGIPDNILLKPGKLTPAEFEIIKTHVTIGSNIIESIAEGIYDCSPYFYLCRDIALYHHERWDGNGYAHGLKGEKIPLQARILSIVDVYDALTSKRCYKEAYTHEEAMQIIAGGRATQFDPELLDCFLDAEGKIRELACKLKDV